MNPVIRLQREWHPAACELDPDRASRHLRATRRDDTLFVERTNNEEAVLPKDARAPDDRTFDDLCSDIASERVERLDLGPEVYTSVPLATNRVRLLRACSQTGARSITLRAVIQDEATHSGRLAFDVPRRLLRALGIGSAEPGDRFGARDYRHHFFDEEALLQELGLANLRIRQREGSTYELARGDDHASVDGPPPRGSLREGLAVLRILAPVELARLREPAADVVATARDRGRKAHARSRLGRARLRRAIGWIDAFMPRGGNCFRRVLLELSLDGGAAEEELIFGLDVGRTGHVSFAGDEDRRFDVSFRMPPNA